MTDFHNSMLPKRIPENEEFFKREAMKKMMEMFPAVQKAMSEKVRHDISMENIVA
jgi:hypothetical protein